MTKAMAVGWMFLGLASCGGAVRAVATDAPTTPSAPPGAASAVPSSSDSLPTRPGSSPGADATKPSGSGDVLLTLYLEARRPGGQKQALFSGSELHSGDSFWLFVGARAPVYLYVLYAGVDGSASVLYPQAGELLIPSGQTQRVPQVGEFQLDEAPGWERILIVGSRAPLARSDSKLDEVIQSVRRSQALPPGFFDAPPFDASEPQQGARASPPEPAKPPERAKAASAQGAPRLAPKPYGGATPVVEPLAASSDLRGFGPTRGIRLTKGAESHVDAVPDEDGIVTIPLLIKHLR